MIVKKLIALILDSLTCDLLYSGSFTSGTTSLNKSIANYKKLIFVYHDNDGTKHTKVVITDNVSAVNTYLDATRIYTAWYAKGMVLGLNGTSMSAGSNAQAYFSTVASGTYITIDKVYGCKSIVGGYFISSLLSTIERWWRYGSKEVTCAAPHKAVCRRHCLHCVVDGNIDKCKQCESNKQDHSAERHLHVCAEMPNVQSGSGSCVYSQSVWNYERRNVCKRAIGRNHSPNAITTNRGLCGNGYEPSHDIHVYGEGIFNGSAYCIAPGRGCCAC